MKKTLYYRFWEGIARLIFPKRETTFEVPLTEEPAVFVSNHAAAIGPSNVVLYFPLSVRPWIISYMFDKDCVKNYIYHDFLNGRSWRSKRFARFVAWLVSILLPPLLIAQNPIKVYRTGMSVLNTFKESVYALKSGQSVIIYPETPVKRSPYIYNVAEGFVDIGKLYYDETGKKLKFYPMYIPNKIKTISVGVPVEYDPTAARDEERSRIAEYIMCEIERLGASLPEHTPIEYKEESFYKHYAEFVGDPAAYWKLVEQKRSE